MRTNIDIDEDLMREAMAATNTSTKKAAVEASLRQTIQLKRQGEAIEGLKGLATWVGPEEDWLAPDPLVADSSQEDSPLIPQNHDDHRR